MEYREFPAESVSAGDEGVIEGLVTPFNRETIIGDLDHGGFREEVAKGAFTKTLAEGDPLMVYQHDLTRPLARKSAGNLELREDAYEGQAGLAVRATPADTSYARDLRELVKSKVIRGMSFGFNTVKDDWYDDKGNPSNKFDGTHRVLREVKLIEVSPVTRPAYTDTAISARDEAAALIEERAGSPKPYGDVAYADPKNGKYPVDKSHVKAAWAYINQAKNAAKYPLNGVSLASVKAKIKAAMKKFGFTSGSAGDENNSFEFVRPEWRDDDPYFDDWYEIDADPDEANDGDGEPRDERDDPDGKEYAAIDEALRHLQKTPADHKAAIGVLRKNQTQRDDPDGQEYGCIDQALRHLQESPPDVKSAISVLRENQMRRGGNKPPAAWDRSQQEPDTSTPDDEDDFSLRARIAMAKQRSRELGFI